MKPRRKKVNRRKRPEKPVKIAREAERTMKVKSLADYVDKKTEQIKENEHQTFAQEDLVCPFCGWKHDAEDLNIRKQSEGLVKCSGCGEAFEFEAVRKVAYTTFVP